MTNPHAPNTTALEQQLRIHHSPFPARSCRYGNGSTNEISDELRRHHGAEGFPRRERCLIAGELAPGFELPNALGFPLRSNAFLRYGPLVVSFHCGSSCPHCTLELQALQTALPKLERCGASLLAVSSETPDRSLALAKQHGFRFQLLSDPGNRIARQFGLVFNPWNELASDDNEDGMDFSKRNEDAQYELPVPATYVIDVDGIIRFIFIDTDHARYVDTADGTRPTR